MNKKEKGILAGAIISGLMLILCAIGYFAYEKQYVVENIGGACGLLAMMWVFIAFVIESTMIDRGLICDDEEEEKDS